MNSGELKWVQVASGRFSRVQMSSSGLNGSQGVEMSLSESKSVLLRSSCFLMSSTAFTRLLSVSPGWL